MKRNWLIRTKNNKILGPLPKEKVVELYNAGDLKELDEVCSGNGYWFWIKEKELVEKYLVGEAEQSFNPVSEAQTVLCHSKGGSVLGVSKESNTENTQVLQVPIDLKKKSEKLETDDDEEVVVPLTNDLDYPDDEFIENVKDEVEKELREFKVSNDSQEGQDFVEKRSEKHSKKMEVIKDGDSIIDETDVLLPEVDDLDYPDTESFESVKDELNESRQSAEGSSESYSVEPLKNQETDSTSTDKKDVVNSVRKVRKKRRRNPSEAQHEVKRNDFLMMLAIVLMAFAIIFIFYTQYEKLISQKVKKSQTIFFSSAYGFDKTLKKKLV
ncbi:MAG: hypothetical protein VX341_10425 [Bdellovibrionota bacterium]|nr:hypothetical protein [Bdellovibrionota bacterium]